MMLDIEWLEISSVTWNCFSKISTHMEDLRKEDFTSIQTNRPHNVVQELA